VVLDGVTVPFDPQAAASPRQAVAARPKESFDLEFSREREASVLTKETTKAEEHEGHTKPLGKHA
jgi:hypothetical protein